jgi:hypothetical protein
MKQSAEEASTALLDPLETYISILLAQGKSFGEITSALNALFERALESANPDPEERVF